MNLPERTADAAVYILSGEIPIEAEVDKKLLSQLMNIFRGEGIEKELARRQLAMKDRNSHSWFIYAAKTLENMTSRQYMTCLRIPSVKRNGKN